MNKILIRWNDKNGEYHEKEYDTSEEATKARAWLANNGADNIDMAIRIKKKTQETVDNT